jgi:chemotaxis response regulator CheB
MEVVFPCSSGNEATQKSKEMKPDVVLIDSQMTGCAVAEAVSEIISLLRG